MGPDVELLSVHDSFPTEMYFLNPDVLRRLLGPGVYLLENNKERLYIGSAKNMLARIADADHTSARMALAEATSIKFFCEISEGKARQLEADLIAQCQPKYNKVGKAGHTYKAIFHQYE